MTEALCPRCDGGLLVLVTSGPGHLAVQCSDCHAKWAMDDEELIP